MNASADAAEGTLANDLVQLVVVLDVVLVLQVELLWVELDTVALGSLEGASDLEEIFKVLPRERDQLLRLITHNFLHKILEYSRELIWYFDLFGCENSHFSNV